MCVCVPIKKHTWKSVSPTKPLFSTSQQHSRKRCGAVKVTLSEYMIQYIPIFQVRRNWGGGHLRLVQCPLPGVVDNWDFTACKVWYLSKRSKARTTQKTIKIFFKECSSITRSEIYNRYRLNKYFIFNSIFNCQKLLICWISDGLTDEQRLWFCQTE